MQTRQNQFKCTISIHPLFEGHFWGPGEIAHMTRKTIFLVKPVQNLYLGKVRERRLFNPFFFGKRTKK